MMTDSQRTARTTLASVMSILVGLLSACGATHPTAEARSAVRPTTSVVAPGPSSTSSVPEPSTTLPPTTLPPPPPPSTAPPVTAIPTDQEGRVFGIVSAVDTSARTLVVDVAQYLSGQDYFHWLAADRSRWSDLDCGDRAYDGTQDLRNCSSYGQAQTVVNENTRLRTLSIAPSATFAVAVGGSGENSPVSFERFAEYVNGSIHLGDKYWLTVRDGWVTSVEFQFFS